jgi:hypothetical protein
VDAGIPIIAPSFARQVLRAKFCAPSFARRVLRAKGSGGFFMSRHQFVFATARSVAFAFAAGSAKAAETVKIGVIYPLIGPSLKSCRDDCR